MGVEDNAGIDAVLGVDSASGPGASASTEVLAVRGRGRAIVPDRCHRVSVMNVDDGGSSGDVVVVADMPLRHVDQMMVAEAARCVGHASQAKVGAIGEDTCQKCRFVGSWIAAAQMGEAI